MVFLSAKLTLFRYNTKSNLFFSLNKILNLAIKKRTISFCTALDFM
jgi:hypothetical protein